MNAVNTDTIDDVIDDAAAVAKRYTVYDAGHGVDVMLSDGEYQRFLDELPFAGTCVETGERLSFAYPENLLVAPWGDDSGSLEEDAARAGSFLMTRPSGFGSVDDQLAARDAQLVRKGERYEAALRYKMRRMEKDLKLVCMITASLPFSITGLGGVWLVGGSWAAMLLVMLVSGLAAVAMVMKPKMDVGTHIVVTTLVWMATVLVLGVDDQMSRDAGPAKVAVTNAITTSAAPAKVTDPVNGISKPKDMSQHYFSPMISNGWNASKSKDSYHLYEGLTSISLELPGFADGPGRVSWNGNQIDTHDDRKLTLTRAFNSGTIEIRFDDGEEQTFTRKESE